MITVGLTGDLDTIAIKTEMQIQYDRKHSDIVWADSRLFQYVEGYAFDHEILSDEPDYNAVSDEQIEKQISFVFDIEQENPFPLAPRRKKRLHGCSSYVTFLRRERERRKCKCDSCGVHSPKVRFVLKDGKRSRWNPRNLLLLCLCCKTKG